MTSYFHHIFSHNASWHRSCEEEQRVARLLLCLFEMLRTLHHREGCEGRAGGAWLMYARQNRPGGSAKLL
jgi:hypothetical protein